VVRTLLYRAENFVTEDHDRKLEIYHIKEALKANDYQPWMLQPPTQPILPNPVMPQ
jgi:hypothetical protein